MTPVLEVQNLTKVFRSGSQETTAVGGISFAVGQGETVGLLGPNGAGKTTTIQMLLGLTYPSSGSISYFGRPFPQEREYVLSRINYASAYAHMQGRMTVRHNMKIFAGLYNVPNPAARIDELLELFGIASFADQMFWHLSAGQQTRAILARAFINKPKLLLMDEPTASLDPEIVDKVLTLIEELQKKEQLSILFTSHHMDEVERICDRVIFLSHGTILTEDTPIGLTKRIGHATLRITFDGTEAPVKRYLTDQQVSFRFPRAHVVAISLAESDIPKILFGMSKEKIWMTNIDIQKPNLEDVFLSVAQGKL